MSLPVAEKFLPSSRWFDDSGSQLDILSPRGFMSRIGFKAPHGGCKGHAHDSSINTRFRYHTVASSSLQNFRL